jgi:F0F1-type ATP synthase membrane subunit b/b'
MPQFDSITFFNQLFWFFLIFFSFYIFIISTIIPKFTIILKTRKKKLNKDLISSENLKSEINSVFNSYDKSFIFLTETILNESNLLSNNKID